MGSHIRRFAEYSVNEGLNGKLKEPRDIARILTSDDKAYEILDGSKAPGTTFQSGGCWIAADALSDYYDVPLWVVYNKITDQIEHFVIKSGSMFLDSDGMQSEKQMIRKIKDENPHRSNEYIMMPYDGSMNTEDIVRDPEASRKLIDLFNSK